MNLVVYSKGMKKDWLTGIVLGVLVSSIILMVGMIWPELQAEIDTFKELLDSPIYEGLMGDLINLDFATFEGFIGMYVFIWLEYIIIFVSVFLGVNILSREVDKRTIETSLSLPVPRWQYLLSKYMVFSSLMLAIPILSLGVSLGVALWLGEDIDLAKMGMALFCSWLTLITAAAIAMLCSTITLDSMKSYGLAGGVIVFMWVVERLGALVEVLDVFGKISLFHYIQGGTVLRTGEVPLGDLAVVLVMLFLAVGGALVIFERRDLAY